MTQNNFFRSQTFAGFHYISFSRMLINQPYQIAHPLGECVFIPVFWQLMLYVPCDLRKSSHNAPDVGGWVWGILVEAGRMAAKR